MSVTLRENAGKFIFRLSAGEKHRRDQLERAIRTVDPRAQINCYEDGPEVHVQPTLASPQDVFERLALNFSVATTGPVPIL